jgi:ACS family hexuronate transporter-like MFS transporter
MTRSTERQNARAEISLAIAGKAGTAFGAIGFASLAPFIRTDLGLSTTFVGGILAMVFLGAMLSIVPAGRITDRWPAGRAVGVFLLLHVAGLAIAATAPSQAVFFFGTAVVGLGYGAVDPGTNVLVSANTTQRRRGLLMGLSHTGLTLGGLLGGLVLPRIADATDWRIALIAPIVFASVVAIWGLRIGGPSPERLEKRTREPVRRSSLGALGAYGFVMAGIQLTVLSFLAIYLVDEIGQSKTTAGLGISVLLAGATVGRISWGWLSDRLHSRIFALQLAALGSAITLALLPPAGSNPGLWLLLFGLGFCSIGWNGVYIAVAAEGVGPSAVGQATAIALVFAFAGGFVLPPSFGEIVDTTGSWPLTWLIAAALVAVLMPTLRFSARRLGARRSTTTVT